MELYGLQLSSRGIQPIAEKVQAIVDSPHPTTASGLCSFLRTVGLRSRFLLDFSITAKPLHQLTHKGATFMWTSKHDNAFQRLKDQLANATALDRKLFWAKLA